jgi:hypothetical protein
MKAAGGQGRIERAASRFLSKIIVRRAK